MHRNPHVDRTKRPFPVSQRLAGDGPSDEGLLADNLHPLCRMSISDSVECQMTRFVVIPRDVVILDGFADSIRRNSFVRLDCAYSWHGNNYPGAGFGLNSTA
jgi:hypothetical protein